MTTVQSRIILDDGREYIGVIGTITKTQLGPENDLRFFWASVTLLMDHGPNEYCPILASPADEPSRAVHAHILGILKAAGAPNWESLIGRQVMVLYSPGGMGIYDRIAGLARLDGSQAYLGEGIWADEPAAI